MSFVPYVVEQSAHGERSYDIFSRLLNDRIIVLSEDVNAPPQALWWRSCCTWKGRIRTRISACISTAPGGSISAGMAIHDTHAVYQV